MTTATIKWYYYTGSEWTDISEYVLDKSCRGGWGMTGNKYTDRLARVGEMSLALINDNGYFDPDNASALTGWAINAKVKLVITYDSESWTRFYGTVESIKFTDDSKYSSIANARVVDWMDYAYKRTLTDIGIETYRRGGYAVDKVVDEVGFTPLATQYSEGDYEFDAIFDSLTTTTKAATELNKIVLSENGYLYNRHDKINGETLVFESESYRNGLRTLSQLPVLSASSGYWLTEGGDYVLTEGGDKVILDATQDAHINGTAQQYARTHGENILNSITVTAYPKRIDDTEQTLYSLGTPIKISSGETKTITVRYQNNATKESCNAITSLMIQPVATTDYLMNTKKDGTGTDITSDLTVTVEYHTASADVTMTNASGYKGKVTKLKLRGYGIYQDSNVKITAEDAGSISDYGTLELNIEQQYQRDTEMGGFLAEKIVGVESGPRTKLDKVRMITNTSDTHMAAFLSIDIGDMVKITESNLGLADYFYVQGIEFDIIDGSAIVYSWLLEESMSVLSGFYSLVACEYEHTEVRDNGGNDIADEISFGNIPKMVDLPQMTISAWVDTTAFTGDDQADILCGWLDNAGGFEFAVLAPEGKGTASLNHELYFIKVCSGTGGNWYSSGGTGVPTSEWVNVIVTADDKDITFYINGSSQTTSVLVAPVGDVESWDGMILTLGNITSVNPVSNHAKPFSGKLADVRVYNRILTASDISTINSEGIGGTGVNDGFVFQAPSVLTRELATLTDQELASTDRVFDAINGYVGTPGGTPVVRAIT